MPNSNGTSEAAFQRMLRDRDDARRQLELLEPKVHALHAKLASLDSALEVFEDYFGDQEKPETFQAKPKIDRRRRRQNGHARAGEEPKKVSETSAAALAVVRESPAGVNINDIIDVLRERGVAVKAGPLTRSLNFHAFYNKIYKADDGLWHAAESQEAPIGE